jgi:hypothetical protein
MSQCLQELGHIGARIILSTVNLPDHPPGRAVLFGVQPLAKRSETELRKAESQCRWIFRDHQFGLRDRHTTDQIFCIQLQPYSAEPISWMAPILSLASGRDHWMLTHVKTQLWKLCHLSGHLWTFFIARGRLMPTLTSNSAFQASLVWIYRAAPADEAKAKLCLYLIRHHSMKANRASWVGKETRLRARHQKNRGSIPFRGKKHSLLQSVKTGSVTHSVLFNGDRGSLLLGKAIGAWSWPLTAIWCRR